jgi:uncharacterized protein (TIGR03086 family)
MELRSLMVPAAEASARIMRGVPADHLEAPTPCPDWDVRALINHLIFWSGRFEAAAHKLPPTGPGQDHDFTAPPAPPGIRRLPEPVKRTLAGSAADDWAEMYATRVRKAAEAWSDPAAWEGKTSLTGEGEGVPAAFIGGVVFVEGILHGWDLAVATGRRSEFPDEVVRAGYEHLKDTADIGRQYGVFGPEASVPESAPLLDRLLGVSGRDPAWTP